MSRRTPEQAQAIALMEGWGWGGLRAERGSHVIYMQGVPKWRWCAPSVIRYAEDKENRSAGACNEHLHESWA